MKIAVKSNWHMLYKQELYKVFSQECRIWL